MDKITINKSETADSRTCDYSKVSKDTLRESTLKHILDVKKGIAFANRILHEKGKDHDWTKLGYISLFYKEFKNGFKTDKWWEMHQKTERHHLKDERYIPDDVNLFDILEMLIDEVMAGLARSEKYKKEPISKNLLMKAYENTIKLYLDNIEVEDD